MSDGVMTVAMTIGDTVSAEDMNGAKTCEK